MEGWPVTWYAAACSKNQEAPQQQRPVPAQAGDLQVRAVGQISRSPRAVGGLKRTALREPHGAATGGASRSGPPRASGVGGARQITRRWIEAARQLAQRHRPTATGSPERKDRSGAAEDRAAGRPKLGGGGVGGPRDSGGVGG